MQFLLYLDCTEAITEVIDLKFFHDLFSRIVRFYLLLILFIFLVHFFQSKPAWIVRYKILIFLVQEDRKDKYDRSITVFLKLKSDSVYLSYSKLRGALKSVTAQIKSKEIELIFSFD